MLNKMRTAILAVMLGSAVTAVVGNSYADTFVRQFNLMPMTAVPRYGNDACWQDDNAKLQNICTTTQMITYMSPIGIEDGMYVYVDAKVTATNNATDLECQGVRMSRWLGSWSVTDMGTYNGALGYNLVNLNSLTLYADDSFSIDCWVPAGVKLGSANIDTSVN
ncbi:MULTISPECIES: hypothetical protein [Sorangium]|uniref:hypothetical protein n=1 Tax=Sorangium TaxID=39643 RepID=UPI003D9C4700